MILSLIDKRVLFETKKSKQRPRIIVHPRFGKKHYEPACNTIRDFVGEKFCFNRSDGGDKKFVKTINRAYQILTNDAAREAYNIFGLDEAEKVMNNEN